MQSALVRWVLAALSLFVLPLAAHGGTGNAALAERFIDALQHQRHDAAAAMFAEVTASESAAIATRLQRISDKVGGFSSIRPVAQLPEGRSARLQVPDRKATGFGIRRFKQVRYTSTAADGQPIYYELNLSDDVQAPKVLAFYVHFAIVDEQSARRATRLIASINH